MRISPLHRARQQVDGISNGGPTVAAATGTGPLQFNTAALTGGVTSAPPLVSDSSIVLTPTQSSTSSSSMPSGSSVGEAATASASSSSVPLGTIIGACIGAFIGIVVLMYVFYAWYKRHTEKKLSATGRRNAQGKAEQQRQQAREFQQLDDSEKQDGDVSPTSSNVREQQESDEKNFSMFKKSPSVRSAYTHKTGSDDGAIDLPQLEFTKYHPNLARELSLDIPQKPFAATVRQNSGVSWDGETLGDDSFLSMRSARVDSGTMSPTMVMAKMTPPATVSALHRWESAEVLHTEQEDTPPVSQPSKNPFAEMAEEQRSRGTNPFFNAQDMNRRSRAGRSRSNSRTSRTSRAVSLVRSDTLNTVNQTNNPFLDPHDAVPFSAVEMPTPNSMPHSPPLPTGASEQMLGSERAMASLIAALDLSKEAVEERLRVVSMQGSMVSAYSNDGSDIATMREFPLPPGTTGPHLS